MEQGVRGDGALERQAGRTGAGRRAGAQEKNAGARRVDRIPDRVELIWTGIRISGLGLADQAWTGLLSDGLVDKASDLFLLLFSFCFNQIN